MLWCILNRCSKPFKAPERAISIKVRGGLRTMSLKIKNVKKLKKDGALVRRDHYRCLGLAARGYISHCLYYSKLCRFFWRGLKEAVWILCTMFHHSWATLTLAMLRAITGNLQTLWTYGKNKSYITLTCSGYLIHRAANLQARVRSKCIPYWGRNKHNKIICRTIEVVVPVLSPGSSDLGRSIFKFNLIITEHRSVGQSLEDQKWAHTFFFFLIRPFVFG